MDELVAKMTNLNLNVHKIRKGFALVIVNETFDYHRSRNGAHADRKNIKEFCKYANFTVNDINDLNLKNLKDNSGNALKFNHKGVLITDDLTAHEMKVLFQIISTGDFSSYDAFICFISSHGGAGGILGVDGETVPVQFIVDRFKASDEYCTLVDKPKLFFTQNCRGDRIDSGVPKPDDDHDGDDNNETDAGSKIPIRIPTHADILVAYATVNGYESYRNTEKGSWFIIALTLVLKQHAHNMNLTDMLALVNEAVGSVEFKNGQKQMPCFTSTLRKAVRFKLAETSENDELPAASGESPALS